MSSTVHSSRSVVIRGAVAALLLAVAACGGKSTAAAPTTPKETGGLPFDKEAVRAALAASPGTPCDGAAGETLDAVFQRQSAALGEVDVTFECVPAADAGRWGCTWSTFSRPSGAAAPDDPCGEDGGTSGYQIMTEVTADGALVPDTQHCIAPG